MKKWILIAALSMVAAAPAPGWVEVRVPSEPLSSRVVRAGPDFHMLRGAPGEAQTLWRFDAIGETWTAEAVLPSIEGHTDLVGAEAYNVLLSQRRADGTVEFLLFERETFALTPHVTAPGELGADALFAWLDGDIYGVGPSTGAGRIYRAAEGRWIDWRPRVAGGFHGSWAVRPAGPRIFVFTPGQVERYTPLDGTWNDPTVVPYEARPIDVDVWWDSTRWKVGVCYSYAVVEYDEGGAEIERTALPDGLLADSVRFPDTLKGPGGPDLLGSGEETWIFSTDKAFHTVPAGAQRSSGGGGCGHAGATGGPAAWALPYIVALLILASARTRRRAADGK